MQRPLILAAIFLLSASPILCQGNSTLDKHFVVATPGMSCSTTCTSLGKKDAYFQPFSSNPLKLSNATSLCAAEIGQEGWVAGYQLRGGPPECEVVVNATTYFEDEYACMCLEQGQTQGLVRGDAASCSMACANGTTSFSSASQQQYGSVVRSVAPDTAVQSYACLPFDTTGAFQYLLFGHQDEGSFSCSASYMDQAVEYAQYSCFCVVEKTLAESGLSTNSTSSKPEALATGG